MAESSSRTSLKAGTTKNNAEKNLISALISEQSPYNGTVRRAIINQTPRKNFLFQAEISGYYSKNVVVFGAKERSE